MRLVKSNQMSLGEVSISSIEIDEKSRDDIPKLLRGLQHLYKDKELRTQLFLLLEEMLPNRINRHTGRPGMPLWRIFVLGILRTALNCDYDRLQELSNEHGTLREMLGHGDFDNHYYELQTLKDNIRLLTPEILDKINQLVVKAGHALLKKSDVIHGRCDSFVVKTDVHFPTDINLLFDAMRKSIELIADICDRHERSDWRQHKHNVNHIKKAYYKAQNSKRSKRTKAEDSTTPYPEKVMKAHEHYLSLSEKYLDKVELTKESIETDNPSIQTYVMLTLLDTFIKHAKRQIDQTRRRVMHGEVIPHDEKVFSLFQPHTEWISKGKLGTPVELGVRVCIMEDHHQFILHHHVMEQQTDEKITIMMAQDTKTRFPSLCSASYDRGFYSKANLDTLKTLLPTVVMPKKGKRSEQEKAIEQDKDFVYHKKKHSAVESAINGLDVHGLDKCCDHGLVGFKRYVAIAIVSRNIQRVGAILHNKVQRSLVLRRRRERKAA